MPRALKLRYTDTFGLQDRVVSGSLGYAAGTDQSRKNAGN